MKRGQEPPLKGQRCLICGKPIEHLHHVVPHSQNGMNTLENLAGLCEDCHHLVHQDAAAAQAPGKRKKGDEEEICWSVRAEPGSYRSFCGVLTAVMT